MAQKSEFLEVDLLDMKPIPGESLTKEPGLLPFEKPPKIVRVDQALGYMLMSTINEPDVRKDIVEAIDMGMTVETVVSGLLLNAFSQGIFTPDVAELIKVPLIQFFIQAADEEGIEDIQITNTDVPKEKDDFAKLDIMKNLNPKKFNKLVEENEEDMTKGLEDFEEEEEDYDDYEEPMEGFISRRGIM